MNHERPAGVDELEAALVVFVSHDCELMGASWLTSTHWANAW